MTGHRRFDANVAFERQKAAERAALAALRGR
jgi:hypothetical protein